MQHSHVSCSTRSISMRNSLAWPRAPRGSLAIRALLSLTLLSMLSACVATWGNAPAGTIASKDGSYRFVAPAGWLLLQQDGNSIMSLDGPMLHTLSIEHIALDKAFPKTERKLTATQLPAEIIDYYIAELGKEVGDLPITVLSRAPARIAGRNGFEVALELKNGDGLTIAIHAIGFVDESGYYVTEHRSPRLHYAQRDAETFKALVASMSRT